MPFMMKWVVVGILVIIAIALLLVLRESIRYRRLLEEQDSESELEPVILWLVHERAIKLLSLIESKWDGKKPTHKSNKHNPLYDRTVYGGELRGSCSIKHHGFTSGGDAIAEFTISIRGPVRRLQERLLYDLDLSEIVDSSDTSKVFDALLVKERDDLRKRMFEEYAVNSRLFGRV